MLWFYPSVADLCTIICNILSEISGRTLDPDTFSSLIRVPISLSCYSLSQKNGIAFWPVTSWETDSDEMEISRATVSHSLESGHAILS